MDFPGFSVGKKGPPPQLLGTLSTADLLVHVVRAFSEASIPHPLESIDPGRDIAALELELIFADLAVVERRIERIQVEARSLAAGARGPLDRELALQRRLKEALEVEKPVRSLGLTAEEKVMLSGFNLLTGKPLLNVLNIDESDVARTAEIEAAAREKHAGPDADVIAIAAKAEADVAELSEDDAAEFRRELGLPEQAAAERMLQETVSLLGLITFYTVGPQDTHAWSVAAGTPAQKAAGRIHSDIERGFIRAEVIAYQEFIVHGSEAKCREAGKLRLEGKDYIVQDGDIIHFRFAV
jgi:GTP-binding protein YchF